MSHYAPLLGLFLAFRAVLARDEGRPNIRDETLDSVCDIGLCLL
jgi:hypothetical protein